jgi:hypothetical protein
MAGGEGREEIMLVFSLGQPHTEFMSVMDLKIGVASTVFPS